MDKKLELRLVAIADQANAAYRDALKAFQSFADSLSKLPSEEQQRAIDEMSGIQQVCMYITAEETGT